MPCLCRHISSELAPAFQAAMSMSRSASSQRLRVKKIRLGELRGSSLVSSGSEFGKLRARQIALTLAPPRARTRPRSLWPVPVVHVPYLRAPVGTPASRKYGRGEQQPSLLLLLRQERSPAEPVCPSLHQQTDKAGSTRDPKKCLRTEFGIRVEGKPREQGASWAWESRATSLDGLTHKSFRTRLVHLWDTLSQKSTRSRAPPAIRMAIYNGPARGGTRGGKDQFNWEDVKEDHQRENYLGHAVMAPVGRWQKRERPEPPACSSMLKTRFLSTGHATMSISSHCL